MSLQHTPGPDNRKWRIVTNTKPCNVCGAHPIAAKSASGWNLQCPNNDQHGYHFEQWLPKCVRKWNSLHTSEK